MSGHSRIDLTVAKRLGLSRRGDGRRYELYFESAEQKETVRKRARAANVDMSEYLRRCALAGDSRSLKKIGIAMNEIRRCAKRVRERLEQTQDPLLQEALDDIARTLAGLELE